MATHLPGEIALDLAGASGSVIGDLGEIQLRVPLEHYSVGENPCRGRDLLSLTIGSITKYNGANVSQDEDLV